MKLRALMFVMFLGLFGAWPAVASGAFCGGHTIEWVGGAPGRAFDRYPDLHDPPDYDEPAGMDRALWDALVFDAYDHPTADPAWPTSMRGLPLDERRTTVMASRTVSNIRLCIQAPDESYTGAQMAPYADAAWWSTNIKRFTNASWAGEIKVASCTGTPPPGWVYVREGAPGEVSSGKLAHARSSRFYDAHGITNRWNWSEIVWDADELRMSRNDAWVESSLAHELGHVLGLWHVPPSSGFVMMGQFGTRTWPDDERWLAQWAYNVGPNVQYPGVNRGIDVPAMPLAGILLLGALLGTAGCVRRQRRI